MILPPFETLATFALTSLLIELTPGPNMAYLAVLSASSGRRAGIAAVMGVALGLALLGYATAFGMAALLASSPAAYQGLRWAGVAYMLWLAWETWREGSDIAAAPSSLDGQAAAYFTRGLVTNLLNPKAALFYVSVLPTFIDATRPVVGQAIALSAVYVLVATCVHITIVVLASWVGPIIARATGSRTVHGMFAAMLVGAAIWMAVATSR